MLERIYGTDTETLTRAQALADACHERVYQAVTRDRVPFLQALSTTVDACREEWKHTAPVVAPLAVKLACRTLDLQERIRNAPPPPPPARRSLWRFGR